MIHYGRTSNGQIAPRNVLERLWLNSSGTSDQECWEYLGKDSGSGGHKRIRLDCGTRMQVHRLAWEAHHGKPIPNDLLVLHKCDNPCCFNPAHLFLGTQKDNMEDRSKKGRATWNGKLTLKEREEIKTSLESASKLAKKYNVTTARVYQLKRGD